MENFDFGSNESYLSGIAWQMFSQNGQIGMYSLYRNLKDEEEYDERLR